MQIGQGAPIEAQAFLHIVDNNNTECTSALKNLKLVSSSAAARTTTNTLDDDLKHG